MSKKSIKLMNWHKIFIIAFLCILISAFLPPTNIVHIFSAAVGFIFMIIGCAAATRQGMSGEKTQAGSNDSSKAYIFAIFLTVAIALIYGHFFEFSIFDKDIFLWLKW